MLKIYLQFFGVLSVDIAAKRNIFNKKNLKKIL